MSESGLDYSLLPSNHRPSEFRHLTLAEQFSTDFSRRLWHFSHDGGTGAVYEIEMALGQGSIHAPQFSKGLQVSELELASGCEEVLQQ